MEKNNNYFDLILIITFVDLNYIRECIRSIVEYNNSIRVCIILINQTNTDENFFHNTDKTIIFSLKISKTSSSKARNIGISYIRENKINAEHIMFPDDDSSFDQNFFDQFPKRIEKNKNYLIPILDFTGKSIFRKKYYKNCYVLKQNDISGVGSPNQIIAYNSSLEELEFDEKMGPATLYGSCEDCDLFYRINIKNRYIFTDILYNYHPSIDNIFNNLTFSESFKRQTTYSDGFIYFVIKYKLYSKLFKFFFIPFPAILYFIIKRNFRSSCVYFLLFFYRIYKFIKIKKDEFK